MFPEGQEGIGSLVFGHPDSVENTPGFGLGTPGSRKGMKTLKSFIVSLQAQGWSILTAALFVLLLSTEEPDNPFSPSAGISV